MANFIFTLIQIVIFEMVGMEKYIVGNDDALIIIPDDDIEMLEEKDYEITISLGLKLSSKSFSAKSGVFFEEYSHPKFRDKEILFRTALNHLRGFYPEQARAAVNSLCQAFPNKITREDIEDLEAYFYGGTRPDNVKFHPYIFGGWQTPYRNNLDYSLVEAENLNSWEVQEGYKPLKRAIEFDPDL